MGTVGNVIELHDWTRRLARKRNGDIFGDERNVLVAFEHCPELQGMLAYNEFADRILLRRDLPTIKDSDRSPPAGPEWQDVHLTWLHTWFQQLMPVRREAVQNVVILVSRFKTFHPVREWLYALVWDQKPRILTWLKDYLGAQDHAAYLEAVGPKFLIGTVARVMQPGCQMDTMLVLEGLQGLGKSNLVRALGTREWARDLTHDLASKEAAIHLQGVWIAEMAELASLTRSDQETIKGFVSRIVDRYRPPYGRNSVDRPRQCTFIATTNAGEYLQDPTGARRFWPVECSRVNIDQLRLDAPQLWAEAVHHYCAGDRWYLDQEEAAMARIEQDARQKLSPADVLVLEHADQLLASGVREIEMRYLLATVFDLSPREDPAKAAGVAANAARALTAHGWKRQKPTGRGPNRKQVYRYIAGPPCEGGPYEPGERTSQGSQSQSGPDPDIPF